MRCVLGCAVVAFLAFVVGVLVGQASQPGPASAASPAPRPARLAYVGSSGGSGLVPAIAGYAVGVAHERRRRRR